MQCHSGVRGGYPYEYRQRQSSSVSWLTAVDRRFRRAQGVVRKFTSFFVQLAFMDSWPHLSSAKLHHEDNLHHHEEGVQTAAPNEVGRRQVSAGISFCKLVNCSGSVYPIFLLPYPLPFPVQAHEHVKPNLFALPPTAFLPSLPLSICGLVRAQNPSAYAGGATSKPCRLRQE